MKRLAAFATTFALLTQLASAQTGAQSAASQEPIDSHTTIRSETRLVLVDSVVTDKKGVYVHGLMQKDFKVYEDNKEQPITSFSFESSAAPDPNRKHYLVLFFDNSTVGPGQQTYARDAATKFIDKNAGPNRLMAIVEFGGTLRMSQNFTDDADRLKKVVAGVKFSSVGAASNPPGLPPIRGFSNFSTRGVLGALRDMAKGLADVPGRKQLVFLSGGFPMNQEILTEITATIDACNRSNVAIYPIDVRGLVAPTIGGFIGSLTGFGSLARLAMLNSIPLAGPVAFWQGRGGTTGGTSGGTSGGGTSGAGKGTSGSSPSSPGLGGGTTGGTRTTGTTTGTTGSRSTVTNNNVNNSAGGGGGNNLNQMNQMNQMNRLNQLNRMNSILPPVDNSITGNQQALFALANGTGGFVIVNTNDLLGGLEKIGNEQNEYYVLGYAPVREMEPGACHTLHVKVDKGGTSVRSRSGYCESKTPDLLSGTPAERELEARMAGNVQPTVKAAMQTPFFYTGANTARIDVALDVPPGTIRFVKEKSQFKAVMNVVGIAYLPDGSVGARFSDSVKLNLPDQKEVEAFEAKPYRYEKQFDAASGKYNLKVVFSSAADQFGKLESPLSIEPWDPTGFSLSGLVLSREIHSAKEATPGLDAELLENRVPFIASGMRMTPTGSNTFHKNEKGYIYAEIYEPALAAADTKDPPVLGVQLKLLDGATDTVKQDFGLIRLNDKGQLGNPAVPLGLVLNVQDMAPGTYRVSVTALDAAGHQFTRTAPIEVLN
jgi:VWFA-related protein